MTLSCPLSGERGSGSERRREDGDSPVTTPRETLGWITRRLWTDGEPGAGESGKLRGDL